MSIKQKCHGLMNDSCDAHAPGFPKISTLNFFPRNKPVEIASPASALSRFTPQSLCRVPSRSPNSASSTLNLFPRDSWWRLRRPRTAQLSLSLCFTGGLAWRPHQLCLASLVSRCAGCRADRRTLRVRLSIYFHAIAGGDCVGRVPLSFRFRSASRAALHGARISSVSLHSSIAVPGAEPIAELCEFDSQLDQQKKIPVRFYPDGYLFLLVEMARVELASKNTSIWLSTDIAIVIFIRFL